MENVKKSVEGAITYVKAAEGSSLSAQIVVQGSLQTLWGLVNSQVILNILALIQTPMPATSMIIIEVTASLNSKDMYPTETMYENIGNFTEYGTISKWHEKLGYDISNFLPLTGSLSINIVILVLTWLLMLMLIYITLLCRRFQLMRKIGVKLENQNIIMATMRLFYE